MATSLFHSSGGNAPKELADLERETSLREDTRARRIVDLLRRAPDAMKQGGSPQLRTNWYVATFIWPGIVHMRVLSLPCVEQDFRDGVETIMSWGLGVCRYGVVVDLQECRGGTPEHAVTIAPYLHNRRLVTKMTFEGCIFLLDARDQKLAAILMPVLDAIFKQLHKPDTQIHIVIGRTTTTYPNREVEDDEESRKRANDRAVQYTGILCARMALAGFKTPLLVSDEVLKRSDSQPPMKLTPHHGWDYRDGERMFTVLVVCSLLLHVCFLTAAFPKSWYKFLTASHVEDEKRARGASPTTS